MTFKPKTKEPVLDKIFENNVLSSIGETPITSADEAKTLPLLFYKTQILNALLNNQNLLHALHDEEYNDDGPLNGDLFRDRSIFNFLKLPNDKSIVKNYVCYETQLSYNQGANAGELLVYFRVISHEDDCKTDYGVNRADLMAEIISHEFDWSNLLGFHLEKMSDFGETTNDGYIYRNLVYVAVSPNSNFNKVNSRYGRPSI